MNAQCGKSSNIRSFNLERPQTPIVVSVPHSGRVYPPDLRQQTRLSVEALAILEDRHVDRLVEPLAAKGVAIVIADVARAWIDLNRSEREIDPEMVVPAPSRATIALTPKVRGGLGLVPRRLSGKGDIYDAPLPSSELRRRITEMHRPYHDALSNALDAARRRFGTAILLDCHSMPPLRSRNGSPPSQIVIGDRHGSSCAPGFSDRAEAICRALGFRAAHNAPYAGGYILDRHGKPDRHVHALQLEICRSLYLDSARRELSARSHRAALLVDRVTEGLIEEALAGPETLAAE